MYEGGDDDQGDGDADDAKRRKEADKEKKKKEKLGKMQKQNAQRAQKKEQEGIAALVFRAKDEAFCKAETEPYQPPVERKHPNMTVYNERVSEISARSLGSKVTHVWSAADRKMLKEETR